MRTATPDLAHPARSHRSLTTCRGRTTGDRAENRAALAQLPEHRCLAVKNHLQGLTTPEIGALLGWSEPKARNLVYRGLRDSRMALRGLGIEYKS